MIRPKAEFRSGHHTLDTWLNLMQFALLVVVLSVLLTVLIGERGVRGVPA